MSPVLAGEFIITRPTCEAHCEQQLCALRAKSLQLCPTPCDTVDSTHQTPLSMGFSRQEIL